MTDGELTKSKHRTGWTIGAVAAGLASAVCLVLGAIWLADGLESPEANDLSLALGQLAVGAGIIGLVVTTAAAVLARSADAARRRLAAQVMTAVGLVGALLVVLAATGVL